MPGSRSTWVACLVLACLGCGACSVPVAADLDEGEANRIVVALDREGIGAEKEVDPAVEGKFRVQVPRDDAARALSTMADEQLPRPKPRGVLDVEGRGQLVPSPAAEHAQLVAGLGGELERSLAHLDGVLSARVHLNLPPRDDFRDGPPAKTTASVLLEHRGGAPPLTVDAVQRLVAGGAPGLDPANVDVVMVARPGKPADAKPALAHVGPIAVAPGSVGTLRVVLAGLVLFVLSLASLALALYAKLVRTRREHDATNRPTFAPGEASAFRPPPGIVPSRAPGPVSMRPPTS